MAKKRRTCRRTGGGRKTGKRGERGRNTERDRRWWSFWHSRSSKSENDLNLPIVESKPAAEEPPLSSRHQQEVFKQQCELANNQTHSENNPDVLLQDISSMPYENDEDTLLKDIIIVTNYGPYALNGKEFYFKYDSNNFLVYLTSNTTPSDKYNILKIAMPKTSSCFPKIAMPKTSSSFPKIAMPKTSSSFPKIAMPNLYIFNCTLFYLQCRVVALHMALYNVIKSEEEEQDPQLMQCFNDMEYYANLIMLKKQADEPVYSRLSQVINNPLKIRQFYTSTHAHDHNTNDSVGSGFGYGYGPRKNSRDYFIPYGQ